MTGFEDEIGWLIEMMTSGRGIWWAGGPEWTVDSVQAIRFARLQDASNVINGSEYLKGCSAFPTEHIWYGPKEGV